MTQAAFHDIASAPHAVDAETVRLMALNELPLYAVYHGLAEGAL